MSTPQSVGFFSSITTKVTLALMISFALIIALVFYVVDKEGYEKIRQETDKLIIQQGENATNAIDFNIKSVMRSATQLRDTSEILPLKKSSFQATLDDVFNQDNLVLLGSGGIWPDAYKLDQNQKTVPLVRLRSDQGFVTPPASSTINSYQEAAWFKAVKALKPQSCLWNHVVPSQTGNELAISCGLSIERNNEFWGATTVNFTLDEVQANIEQLNEELGEGYAILVDNSNQIIASSDAQKIPFLNKSTGKPLSLNSWVDNNPSWQPILDMINDERQEVMEATRAQAPETVIGMLMAFDKSLQTEPGSMLLNYAAFAEERNPYTSNIEHNILGSFDLTDDAIYQEDARAYVFTVPETLWKLVIVKSEEEVNSIADALSKNLIKYLIFALLLTAALIFFLLDFLALRPLQDTTNQILEADKLIDDNKYNQLSDIKFSRSGDDEIGIVNSSLVNLLAQIERNEGQLADINQQLEIKVEERTKELRASQVQLIRSEKMATLGQMVAGVAHEVNTPLSYVQNNLEIIGQLSEQYEELIALVSQLKVAMTNNDTPEADIKQLLDDVMTMTHEIEDDELTDELKELIKDSLFGVEQITDMVLNLRNFARLDESKVKQIDLRECIESSLKIARNTIKQNKIITELNDIPEVSCSPSQINQVLVNLFNNASQAIGNDPDGQITVETRADDTNVYIDVIDNGSGMTQEVAERLFEPFFTTKGAGEGTGLGMAISQQIMEQHNARIEVDSTLGEGTHFTLVFPIDNNLTEESLAA